MYCVYFHINPVKNEIFYVGMGLKNRPYVKHGRNEHWKNTVKKYNYVIDIIEENLTKEEAYQKEIFYIAKIGRKDLDKGPLVNKSNGGDGGNLSPESKEKCRLINLGRIRTSEEKEKNRIAHLGKKMPKEFGIKKSNEMMGNTYGSGSKGKKRRPRTIEEKNKISESMKRFKNKT